MTRAPGRMSRTDAPPARAEASHAPPEPAALVRGRDERRAGGSPPPPPAMPRFDFATLALHRDPPALQLRTAGPGPGALAAPAMYATAAAGVAGAGQPLPHRERIQRAFGPAHDLTRIAAHIGGRAWDASARLGADGYAIGEHVAFRTAPDVRLAAHEAAHVVQQRGGVQLKDRVGRPGDAYERAADAVADAVVAGRSAGGLLGARAGAGEAGLQLQSVHTQHPNQPAYPRVNPLNTPRRECDPRALAALDTEVVDLQGTGTFRPSYWLAVGMACMYPDPVHVRARFGSLATGVLALRVIPELAMTDASQPTRPVQDYETASDEEFLELHHPSFPGAGLDDPPRLQIAIRNSQVTGRVSFSPGERRLGAIDRTAGARGFDLARVLGWRGLSGVVPGPIVNELAGGVLRYAIDRFTFRVADTTLLDGKTYDAGDVLGGIGTFHVVDDREDFDAGVTVEGDGIAPGKLPLRKTEAGISGAVEVPLQLAPNDTLGGAFAGSARADFAGGLLTVQGTARYQARRASGALTVMLAPRAAAWAHVAHVLPPPAIAPTATSGGSRYALVGWGTLQLAVNDWLTGSVSAVLDPDGYLTTHGILRPTRDIVFLDDTERSAGPWTARDQIGPTLEASTPWIPAVAFFGIRGTASARALMKHGVGPGRIFDLEVQGRFSTRPGSLFEASATGRISVAAWAKLRAELRGAISFSVPGDVIKAGSLEIAGTGTATARAVVELQPRFERLADPAHPDRPRFRISGALRASGAIDLALQGGIVVKVVYVPVWSLNLRDRAWKLGALDVEAAFSHVIGEPGDLGARFTPHGLDSAAFGSLIGDLLHERVARTPARADRLAQDPTTAAPPPVIAPTRLRLPFHMNNASHELWVEYAPNAVLKMASGGDSPLDNKLEAEADRVTAVERRAEGPAAEALGEEAAHVETLLAQAQAVERSLDSLRSESHDARDAAGFGELVDALTAYGTQYQRSDLGAPDPSPTTAPREPATSPGADLARQRREAREQDKREKAASREAVAAGLRRLEATGNFPSAGGKRIEPRIATPDHYVWRHPEFPDGNYIDATMYGDTLSLEVRSPSPNPHRRGGKQLLDDVFAYFNDASIRKFSALWIQHRSWDTNYRKFMSNLATMNPQDAAWNTWIGEYLRYQRRFKEVRIDRPPPGQKSVSPVFTR